MWFRWEVVSGNGGVDSGLDILGSCFKRSSFESKRRRVISTLLSNESTLYVVPANTNGSVYCRVPTLLFSKIAVIISPLVSLVGSRINSLIRSKIPTTCVGDSLSCPRFLQILSGIRRKGCGVVCITPRELLASKFLSAYGGVGVSVITISRTRYISR